MSSAGVPVWVLHCLVVLCFAAVGLYLGRRKASSRKKQRPPSERSGAERNSSPSDAKESVAAVAKPQRGGDANSHKQSDASEAQLTQLSLEPARNTVHQSPHLPLEPPDRENARLSPDRLPKLSPLELIQQRIEHSERTGSANQADDGDSSSEEEDWKGVQTVIVVAYRLPVHIERRVNHMGKATWEVTRWDDYRSRASHIAELRSLQTAHRGGGEDSHGAWVVKWVGYPGVDVPKDEQEDVEELLEGHSCYPVFIPADLHRRFFSGFCKRTFWPLLHYVSPHFNRNFGKQWDDLWQAYTAANMMYVRMVTLLVDADHDFIWIHNYHLCLLPSFLRKKYPRARIGFFMHTPFPTSDVFRTLPSRENLLRGMLCADLIGFNTFDYARHFLSATKRVLDLDYEVMAGGTLGIRYSGRSVTLRISHVGINPSVFADAAYHPDVLKKVKEIRKQFAGRKIIIGIDDLDLVKGSVLKLQAFKRFLGSNPEWQQRVVLIEFIMPTKNTRSERDAVRENLMAEVASIRMQYGDNIVQVVEHDELPDVKQLVSYFVASDAAVISTFWDGLNVIPFQYTASQSQRNPGSLVLSEFLGCSRWLAGVVRVNPWSLDEVSASFKTVLTFSKEQRRTNHSRRFEHVMANTVDSWAMGFLHDLNRASHLSDDLEFVQVGWGSNVQMVGLRSDFQRLELSAIIPNYLRSRYRILLFDYDGTLTVDGKHSTAPSRTVMSALTALAADPKNLVFILSGRGRRHLSKFFSAIPRLGIAAEKGAFIHWPTAGKDTWETSTSLDVHTWKEVALSIMREYTERTNGAYIEDKESAIVWHFENTDVEYGRMQANELLKYLRKVLEQTSHVDVTKYDYNRIVEVKPKLVNKGHTLQLIVQRALALAPDQGGLVGLGASVAQRATGSPNLSPLALPVDVESLQLPRKAASTPWTAVETSATESLDTTGDLPGETMPLLLAIGDDRSDEEMFRSVQQTVFTDSPHGSPRRTGNCGFDFGAKGRAKNPKMGKKKKSHKKLPRMHNTFTCCVGLKPSSAHYYLQDAEDVIELIKALASCSGGWTPEEEEPPADSGSSGHHRSRSRSGNADRDRDRDVGIVASSLAVSRKGYASKAGGLRPRKTSFGSLSALNSASAAGGSSGSLGTRGGRSALGSAGRLPTHANSDRPSQLSKAASGCVTSAPLMMTGAQSGHTQSGQIHGTLARSGSGSRDSLRAVPDGIRSRVNSSTQQSPATSGDQQHESAHDHDEHFSETDVPDFD